MPYSDRKSITMQKDDYTTLKRSMKFLKLKTYSDLASFLNHIVVYKKGLVSDLKCPVESLVL